MKEDSPGLHRIGRPRSVAAESHAAIMDAVYALLQEIPARDLTMEAVAKRANVGKPTLYKWWPSKAALILAMFYERLVGKLEAPQGATAEAAIRFRMRRLIREFNGLFGKVMADLIAEGQSDPTILRDLYERHISQRRAASVTDVERGRAAGEFAPDINPELLVDAIIGPVYFRLLLRSAPLTEGFAEDLISQVLRGARP
jgi:AcrR family transcriptional regulator